MTEASDLFRHLRDTLAGTFATREDAEMLARDAGLSQARLPWAGNAQTFWQAALVEAERTDLVDTLLAQALRRYPTLEELQALPEQYQQWVDAGRPGGLPFPTEAPPPRWTLRPPVADFTGRADDLRTLVDALCCEGAAAAISGIRGMGGIGKTELALKVAEAIRAHYPGPGLMFELQPGNVPLEPAALLGQVIHALQPEARLPDDLPTLQALCRQALAGRRGILLLDNAAGAGQVRPLLPPPAGWAVIVTSRARFALPGAAMHSLELLPADDAVALLRRVLADGGRADLVAADLAPLAEACGRLPLALRVAAGFLVAYPNRTLARYRQLLAQARRTYLAAPDDPQQPDPVFAVLRLSVDALRKRSAALADRWHSLAVFPAPFDLPAAADVWNMTEGQAEDDLAALVQQGLVEWDAATQTYGLHDLLAELAHEGLATDLAHAEEVRFRHAEHYLARGWEATALYLQGRPGVLAGLQAFDAIWPHLAAGWTALHERTDARTHAWLNGMPAAVTYMLGLRVPPHTRIAYLESALAAARRLKDRRFAEYHLGNLGGAYGDLGQPRKATAYYEQALALAREIGDHRGEGNALGNLGMLCADLGEPRQAIAYYERALAILHEIGDRRGKGNALGNLGLAYQALGEPRQAIVCYEQALANLREVGDRCGEGAVLGNLGLAYADLGKPQQAIAYHEQALAINQEIDDRRGEGASLGNLGNTYAALGELRRAITYHEQALAIDREIGDRRGEAQDLYNLAAAYQALGETDRLRPLMQQALRIFEAIEDPNAQRVRAWLATTEPAGDDPQP